MAGVKKSARTTTSASTAKLDPPRVIWGRLRQKQLFFSLAKYAAVYALSKKAFEPLYRRNAMKAAVVAAQKVMGSHSSPLGSANMERVLHATLLGESAHRPAELMVFLSVCLNAILFDKQFSKLRELNAESIVSLVFETGAVDIDSYEADVKCDESDFEKDKGKKAKAAKAAVDAFLCDSLALWIVSIVLDLFFRPKPKNGLRFDDKLQHLHHYLAVWFVATPLLLDRGNWYVAWTLCQMESYGTAAIVLGGLLRTINKAKRSPSALLRYASDLLFACGGLNWVYSRGSGTVRALVAFYTVAIAHGRWRELHPMAKAGTAFGTPVTMAMNLFWSAQTVRVVLDKFPTVG